MEREKKEKNGEIKISPSDSGKNGQNNNVRVQGC